MLSRVVLTDAEVARVSVCACLFFLNLCSPRESGLMASRHGDGWLLYLEQGRSGFSTLFITECCLVLQQSTWQSIKDIAPPPFQVVTSASLGILNNYYGGLRPGGPGEGGRQGRRSIIAVASARACVPARGTVRSMCD